MVVIVLLRNSMVFVIKNKPNQGFTLVELLVVIALIGIALMIATPSFSDFFAKQKLRGLGGELLFFTKLAKAEAAKKSSKTYIVFNKASNTSWCIGLSEDDDSCDCTTVDSCMVDGIERVISSTDYANVSFDTNTFAGGKFSISPYKGRSIGGTATFSITADGVTKDLSLKRSSMGRDKICSPSGNSLRYPVCP